MTYKYETGKTSNNMRHGRPGKPKFIVIHHWGIDGQRHDNVVNYLCRPNGTSSAHYIVSAGRVTCIVDPDDRAWHAGPKGNPYGIGIECRPECTPGDFQTVAELIADLRKTYGPLPLHGHREFMNTECPGRWYPRLSELSALADSIGKHPSSTPPKTSSTPAPKTSSTPNLEALATDVIAGKYGNGNERKRRLGNLYGPVQAIVNKRLKGLKTTAKPAQAVATKTPNLEQMATDVIRGKYGNGAERKRRLGALYGQVQAIVNKRLKG